MPGDHGAFHGTVLRAAIGGAAGGLVAFIVAGVVGVLDPQLAFAIAVSSGALGAAAIRPRKWGRGLWGALLGGVGGALFSLALPWPAFAAALLGATAVPALAPQASARRRALTWLMASSLGGAGLFVAHVLLGWDPLGGWLPAPLTAAAAGAAGGLFLGLASAPKHLAPPRDPVEQALRAGLGTKDGEIHALLERALGIHRALRSELQRREDDDPTAGRLRERSGQAVLRILEIANQCRQVDRDLATTPVAQLQLRISELSEKEATARDPAAKTSYKDAIESLRAQIEAIDRIELGRERIVARLHANVAILEKLRLSLIHLRNAQAERIGGEASPVVEALDELGRELDATATAFGEVFGRSLPDRIPDSDDPLV